MSKPIVKQKPKPPPYPRPVPKLDIEDLPPRQDDLVWNAVHGGGYYSEEDEKVYGEVEVERRAAKRRRIQACAEAYLRGGTLQIMTAQLKGPFKEGWKNPWAKERRRQQPILKFEQSILEIPETKRKTTPSGIDVKKDDVAAGISDRKAPLPIGSPRRSDTKPTTIVEHAPSPFTSRIQQLPDETSPKVPKQAKERRVQEWLRTNDAFTKNSEVLVHSSPTPARRRHKTPGDSQDNGDPPRESQSEPPRVPSADINSTRSAISLQGPGALRLHDATKRVQKLSRDMQNIVTEPTPQTNDTKLHEVQRLLKSSSAGNGFDSSRAEHAILKTKRGALQTIPAIAHMSPFEFRKASGDDTAQTSSLKHMNEQPLVRTSDQPDTGIIYAKELEDVNMDVVTETFGPGATGTEEDVFATAPQPERDGQAVTGGVEVTVQECPTKIREPQLETGAIRPALSTAVSEISTADILPSAQPRLEPQQSVSSVTRDERLLSVKPVASTSENSEEQKGGRSEILRHEETDITNDALVAPPVGDGDDIAKKITHRDEETSTPKPVQYAADLNTQEMLANIVPLTLSTVKKSKTLANIDSPATATKTRSDRKRKKASFAGDRSVTSSHGSIKEVMNARISKRRASPPMFLLGKDDLDIELASDENSLQPTKPRRSSSMSKPKGILKSTNPSSSPTSLRKLKAGYSTGQEQEGQLGHQIPLPSEQIEIDEDNFDLDAAIDDLGSFLGTWDAEKEASSLDIEL